MNENEGTPSGDVIDNDAAPDVFKNIKGEMHRKFEKTDEKINQLAETNRQLVEQLRSLVAPKQAAPAQDSGDIDPNLQYTNPAKYQRMLIEKAKEEMRQEHGVVQAAQVSTQQTISQLISEYPELADQNHELTLKTVELYTKMSDNDKKSPAALKAAAFQAAAELDVKPKHKRPTEDFIDSGYAPSERRTRRAPTKLDPATEMFAQAIGIDITQPGVKERLIERSQRDWKTPQTPISTKRRKK